MSRRHNGGTTTTRRRTSPSHHDQQDVAVSTTYYDDDSDNDNEHAKHHNNRMYGGACNIGKFFLNPCLCITMTLKLYCRRRAPSRIRREAAAAALYILIVLVLCYVSSSLFYNNTQTHHPTSRPQTDYQLNSIPIRINLFDFEDWNDLGGWLHPPAFAKPKPIQLYNNKPNHGGLLLDFSQFGRLLDLGDDLTYAKERIRQLKQMDKHKVSLKYLHDDELEFSKRTCRRPNWKKDYFPNCLGFHELDLSRPHQEFRTSDVDQADYESRQFSNGYYRDVWMVESELLGNTVLKVARFTKHKMDHRMMDTVQRDAVVMEKLTSSERIVDIYGHCGTSVMVEPIAKELEEFIVPGSGYIKHQDLNDSEDVDVQNNYSPTDKLHMALAMAESLADLHGFKDGVIVHDDVQLCQWLETKDGTLKLGDFNRAEVMEWNDHEHQYCKYNNGEGFGNYRAPEEFAVKDLDEKIDVFSFGNNIYALLTGLWVFYNIEDDGIAQDKLIAGDLPFVDDRYRTRSFAEGKLVQLMERCWIFDPDKRIDIFEAVTFLRNAVAQNKELASLSKEYKYQ